MELNDELTEEELLIKKQKRIIYLMIFVFAFSVFGNFFIYSKILKEKFELERKVTVYEKFVEQLKKEKEKK